MFDTVIRVTISDPLPGSRTSSTHSSTKEAAAAVSASATFEVHRGILTFYSDYFKASLDGDFSEAHNKHVELSSESVAPKIFRMFIGWVYTRRLRNKSGSEEERLPYMEIIRMWIFADAYLVPLLKNHCINLLYWGFAVSWHSFDPPHIYLAYSNTTATSALRRALVDILLVTCVNTNGWIKKITTLHQWPNDFLCDVLRGMAPLVAQNDFKPLDKEGLTTIDTCKYHEHPEGVKCEIQMQKVSEILLQL